MDDPPWVRIDLTAFMHAVVEEGEFIFTAKARPDVTTRRWYTLTWTGADGTPCYVQASEMRLLLKRAAAMQIASAQREEAKWTEAAPHAGDTGEGARA